MNHITRETKEPLAVRTKEAARLLGVGRTTLHHLVKFGRVPCKKENRINWFMVADLKAFLKPPSRHYSDLEAFDVVLNTLKGMCNNG